MTRRPYPARPSRSDTDEEGPVHRVSGVGNLIAALPALLGFVPEQSIVLVCLGPDSTGAATTVEVVMRHDLPPVGGHLVVQELAGRCAEVCVRDGVLGVVAILVTGTRSARGIGTIASTLAAALEPCGIELLGVHRIAHLVTGERWTSAPGDTRRGVLPDPMASPSAASRVVAGRQIRGARSDIERSLSLLDTVTRERFAHEVDMAAAETEDLTPGRLFSRATAIVAAVHRAGHVEDRQAAFLAVALTVITVRDALLSLADSDHAEAAEQVWVYLTRRLTGPDRAPAATMVGVWSYARGDGPLAGVALQSALEAAPEYSFAVLLDTALQNGVRPDVVRELIASAHDLADDPVLRDPEPDPGGYRAE